MRVVNQDAIFRATEKNVKRRFGAFAGQVPKRHINRGQRRRRDAAGRQRMNALTQMFVNEDYASSVLADEPIKQFSAEQFEDRGAASADRVTETDPGAISTISDRDDW